MKDIKLHMDIKNIKMFDSILDQFIASGQHIPKIVEQLKKVKDCLILPLSDWSKEEAEIYNKHAITIPYAPFISPERYEAFKKEIILLWKDSGGVITSGLGVIFQKYEQVSDFAGKMAVPKDKVSAYIEDLNEAESRFKRQLVYKLILISRSDLAKLMQHMTSDCKSAAEILFVVERDLIITPSSQGSNLI